MQARLITSAQDLDVSPTDWMEVQFVPPDPATWTWVVTSKAAGDALAVLQLKPVVRITRGNGETSSEDLRTEEYPVTFTTEQTATERASGYWALLVGLAAGLVTLIGLWQAVRGLRKRSAKGEDEDVPSHKA